MPEGARVESIDALKAFRRALFKFAEGSSVALGDAESEIHRAQIWLETEQRSHWHNQVRVRTEMVAKAKEAVRMKKLYKDATGGRQSAVEEEKALAMAQKRLAEAEQKVIAVKRYASQLQKDYHVYKGAVQRFATNVEVELQTACAQLANLAGTLDTYVATRPAEAASSAPASDAPAMTRGDVDERSPSPGIPGEGRGEGPA